MKALEINQIDPPTASKLKKVALVLKTIAHPIRLNIIHILENNNQLMVNEICQILDCEQSLISHHLRTMKIKGILQGEKKGRKVYYSIREKDVLLIMNCFENCVERF